MRGQLLLAVGAATLGMASFSPATRAATLDPIAWSYQASVCDCESAVSVEDSSTGSPGKTLPQSGSANWPPPDFGSSVINGNAAVTITNFPAILTTVALSQSNNPFDPLGRAQAYGEMTYQFEISPIDGSLTGGIQTVPILFNGTYSGGIQPTTGGITGTGVQMNVTSTADSSTLYTLTGNNGRPGQYGGSIDVTPGVIYSVFMAAQAVVEQTTGGASAAIDPHFFLDPQFNGLFQIQFSPGIQNAAATTPIPAALPLFAAALGGLGFIGWRRRISQS